MSMSWTKPQRKQNAHQTWDLATNHLNLLYMLAAGLVMAPSGFRGKHYADSLDAIPGWIPLFRFGIPAKALEQSVSERGHLRPCVVSLNLSDSSGPAKLLLRDGGARDVILPNFRLGNEGIGILVQAPLPLTLISHITFCSIEDRQAFETAAKDVSNADWSPYLITVDNTMFQSTIEAAWPPEPLKTIRRRSQKLLEPNSAQGDLLAGIESLPHNPHQSQAPRISSNALGGLIGMLYNAANHSDLSVQVFQQISGSLGNTPNVTIQDTLLAELPKWLNGGMVSDISNIPARLYWGIMTAIAATPDNNSASTPVETVLEFLDNQLSQLSDEKYRPRLERLLADMRGCLGLGGGTITELFERNKGSLSRPLLLFCLREHCIDLLEFSHPELNDAEYILASMLFGVRDGWLNLPCAMRQKSLSAYVMYRMASLDQQALEGSLSLPQVTPPQPLRAFFPGNISSWSKEQTNAAIEISKVMQWQDCIETFIYSAHGISLGTPRSEYGTFIFQGLITAKESIVHDAFFKRLACWPPIEIELESKIKNNLKSASDHVSLK